MDEVRASVEAREGYTDSITAAFASAAEGAGGRNPLRTAALEAAACLYAACFAAARVTPPPSRRTAALTAPVRALMGRRLVRQGEDVHRIVVRGGRVRLLPAGYWTVQGSGADERGWRYQVTEYGPSGSDAVWVPSSEVLHPRLTVDGSRPWQGVPPWSWAGDDSALLGGAVAALSREMGASAGYVVPLPHALMTGQAVGGRSDGPGIREQMQRLGGRTLFAPSAKSHESLEGGSRSISDWEQRRLGAHPPETLLRTRDDASAAVLAACGVPAALVDPGADGTSQREAWRRFAMGPLAAAAAVVEAELSVKLNETIEFDFRGLWAHDLQGRASAFQRLVAGGMGIPEAAAASGVLVE